MSRFMLFQLSQFLTKVKLRRVELLTQLHLRATECHLPYGIAQCYLPPDTEAVTRFTYPEGIAGWVYLGDRLHTDMVYPPSVTHPSTNLPVHGWESNSRPVDHKSDAPTITLTNMDFERDGRDVSLLLTLYSL